MPTTSLPSGHALTVEGFPLWVRTDPFEYGIDEQGRPWRAVAYVCDGDDGPAVADALMGINSGSSSLFDQPKPHKYPGNENLLCLSVRGKPKGARGPGTQLVKGPLAEIHATYGVPEFDVYGEDFDQSFGDETGEPIPWARYLIRGGLEMIPWPIDEYTDTEGQFLFDIGSDGEGIVPAVRNLVYRMPVKDYIIRRSKIPNLPLFDAMYTSYMGTVNDAAVWGKDAGTILCEPHDYDIAWDSSGARMGEFTMVFRWRKYPWTWEPVPGKFGVFAPVRDSSANRMYEEADFETMLRYGV